MVTKKQICDALKERIPSKVKKLKPDKITVISPKDYEWDQVRWRKTKK